MQEINKQFSNNNVPMLKLEIKQKNINIKKRKVKTWSPQEDHQLTLLYQQYPKKWGIIASYMQDRNQNQCLHRYRRLSQLGAHKKIWSSQQDQTILSLIKKIGKNWKLLSQMIGTKTGKQIRQRFINKLDPKIKTDDWTDDQDQLILKYYSQVGSRWSQISKKLIGRPQNQIKNRFYSYIQKNYDIRYVVVDSNNINQKQSHIHLPPNYQPKQKLSNNELKSTQQKIPQNIFKQLSCNEQKQQTQKQHQKKSKFYYQSKKYHDHFYQDQNQQFCPKSKITKHHHQQKHSQKLSKQIPSIKQLIDQFKIFNQNPPFHPKPQPIFDHQVPIPDQKDEYLDSIAQISQKYYIKSLIRVQDQISYTDHNKDRSIKDLVSNNQIQSHQNDLFYLLNN